MDTVDVLELANYSVVQISGADRREFLQGQLTQDVDALTARHSILAGWTTAKGRLLAVGPLIEWNASIYLPLHADIANKVAQRLKMFVLRADVDVDLANAGIVGLIAGHGDPIRFNGLELSAEPGACSADETTCVARIPGDPTRAWAIGAADQQKAGTGSTRTPEGAENQWSLRNIRSGIPEIRALTSEMFVPQMVNLDLLDGVSFTKGCYVGQEIVARTQNLGRIKRRMYRFQSNTGEPIAPGQLIYGPDNATGKIVSSCPDGQTTEILAVIAIDAAEGQWFSDEDRTRPITSQPLPYPIPNPA